jgi:hypothetical protein
MLDLSVQVDGLIYHPKVNQDGHGQHGRCKILLYNATNLKSDILKEIVFETGNRQPPRSLSIVIFKNKSPIGIQSQAQHPVVIPVDLDHVQMLCHQ